MSSPPPPAVPPRRSAATVVASLPGHVDRLLTSALRLQEGDDSDVVLRGRALALFAAMMVFVSLGWTGTHLADGNWWMAAIYLGAVFAAFLVLARLRTDGNVTGAGRSMLLISLVVIVLATWFTGGLRANNIAPYFVLLVASVFLLGRGAAPWAALSILAPLCFELGEVLGYEFPDLVPLEGRRSDAFITWLSSALIILIFIGAYERARTVAAERLLEADRAKNQFLANVSHELRSPLHVIAGVNELLGQHLAEGEPLALIERARQNTLALGQLVDDLLDMASLEHGRFALHPSTFDLRELFGDLERVLRPWCERRFLTLTVEIGTEVPDLVRGDALRLRQVVMNLAGNALKFTEEGGITLRVTQTDPRDPYRIAIEVSDTGIGVALEQSERIFDGFYQADGALTRRYGGTGLGLYISKQIVQEMGGDITLASVVGQGSSFRFEVPLGDPNRSPTDEAPIRRLLEQPMEPARVLVVDDNEDSREVVRALLGALGHTVRTASGGSEALEIWEQWQPEVVFMDVQMPEMTGYEATERLRAREAEQGRERVVVIALTGHCRPSDRQACKESGMDGFLGKPFTAAQLRSALIEARRAGRGTQLTP